MEEWKKDSTLYSCKDCILFSQQPTKQQNNPYKFFLHIYVKCCKMQHNVFLHHITSHFLYFLFKFIFGRNRTFCILKIGQNESKIFWKLHVLASKSFKLCEFYTSSFKFFPTILYPFFSLWYKHQIMNIAVFIIHFYKY